MRDLHHYNDLPAHLQPLAMRKAKEAGTATTDEDVMAGRVKFTTQGDRLTGVVFVYEPDDENDKAE